MMKKTIIALTIFAGTAWAINEHPILQEMVTQFGESKNKLGQCDLLLEESYRKISSLENSEVAFVTLDKSDQSCHFEVLGEGVNDKVELDIDRLYEVLEEEDVEWAQSTHTHVNKNVEYFSKAGPNYTGEIMFAEAAKVFERQLEKEDYDYMLRMIQEQRMPGFNFSPPSLADFRFLVNRDLVSRAKAKKFTSRVITSGGVWDYTISDPANKEKVSKMIGSLVSYGMIYEAAKTPGLARDSKRHEHAKRLLKLIMADSESSALVEAWKEPSLVLRMPYSKAALNAFRDGDSALVRSEYQKKVQVAHEFAAYLTSVGIETEFRAFGVD